MVCSLQGRSFKVEAELGMVSPAVSISNPPLFDWKKEVLCCGDSARVVGMLLVALMDECDS